MSAVGEDHAGIRPDLDTVLLALLRGEHELDLWLEPRDAPVTAFCILPSTYTSGVNPSAFTVIK
jgi:hypothetical protein